MGVPRKARPSLLLLSLALGGVQLAGGQEQKADYEATASKYDLRSSGAEDDYSGCYTDGCSPDLLNDGKLNDVAQSRWSCTEDLAGLEVECYVTFDLGSTQDLSKLSIYFHESNDTNRQTNLFIVATSATGTTYVDSFEGENTAGTPIGEAEDFDFPTGSSGQYVRLTGVLDLEQWLSINEVEIYVRVATPAPSVVTPSPNSTTTPTNAPSIEVYINGSTPTASPTASPTGIVTNTSSPTFVSPAPVEATAGPTAVGGEACSNVTVSNAGDLNGDYSPSTTGSSLVYVSTGVSAATISSSESPAHCADTAATEDCTFTRWQITPVSGDSTLPTYVVYDEATHPSDINEVWLRLDNCSSDGCESSPADVTILCGDGSTAGSETPAPVSSTPTDCEVIEIAGTFGASNDGFYYDDGSDPADDVTQYIGYDDVDGELTSNGKTVAAKRVESTCTSTTTSVADNTCSWRQWWIETLSSDDVAYFTYDEAAHPVDIPPGALWYTSDATILPFDGDVVITCAPATTPLLATPAPGSSGDGDDATRSPVPGTPTATSSPAVARGVEGEEDSGGGGNTALIAGSVAGGVALLAIIGAVAYRLTKPPPPPPSYDDLVGT